MIDTRPDIPLGSTYNERGQELTYKNSSGYWYEKTYDNQGKELTYKDYAGEWYEYFYDLGIFVDTFNVYKI